MFYERNGKSLFLAILKGAICIGLLAFALGLLSMASGEPFNFTLIFNGARYLLYGLPGLVGLFGLATLAGFALIALVGVPLWVIAKSLFSDHWIVVALVGPLIIFGLRWGLGLEGMTFSLTVIAGLMVFASLVGLLVWSGVYRRAVADADSGDL